MIGQPLAFTTTYGGNGALLIGKSKRGAMIVAKIKFREIAVQSKHPAWAADE
jgi:hypothetical protein